MQLALALTAAALAVAGNVPYLWHTVTGTVRPHPYTWLVGAIVSGTVFFGMLAKGAGVGALPIAVAEIFTILIFVVSLKYGYRGITATDTLFLIAAVGGLIPWFFTHDPTVSIVIAVGIDLLSLAPTFRKTWAHPATETALLYSSNVLRHVLVLFSLQTYSIATVLHSVAMICTSTVMTGIILLRKKKAV